MARTDYDVAKHPRDGRWYVIIHLGGREWVPLHDKSYPTAARARASIPGYRRADVMSRAGGVGDLEATY